MQQSQSYKDSCATSTLHCHLSSKHHDEWITSCKKAGIKITATSKDICKALEEFNYDGEDNTGGQGTVPISRTYTPEAFLDMLIEWIVSDDQVCLSYFI